MSGGGLNDTKVNGADVINLFTGNYDVVPSDEPLANNVSYDNVGNSAHFNDLSYERQLQITNAINANKGAFNNILASSTREVLNNMNNFSPSHFNRVVARHQDILQPYSLDMYGGGVDVNASLIADTRKCIESISGKYAKWKQENSTPKVSKGLDFVCNTVVPNVAMHKKKCYAKYGKSTSDQFFERLGQFPSLNFFNVCDVDEPYVSPMSGGSTVVKYIPIMSGGADATKTVLDKMVESQKNYIAEYDKNYKQLKSAIASVNITTSSREPSAIYLIANSLKTISISNRDTPARLSGYYKGTNYNILYTRAIKDAIKNIDSSSYSSAFSEVKSALNTMASLQESSLTKAKSYRAELLKAPKRISEFIGVYDGRMNQQSSLNFEDFNDVDIAIKSLFESITITDKEEVSKRTRDQVEKYMNAMKRRDDVIREYYSNKEIYIKSSAWKTSLYRETAAQNVISEIINVKRAKMLYLNNIIEPALMKYKASSDKKKITKEVLKRLDTAAYIVKNQSKVAEIKKYFEEIKKYLTADKSIAQVEVFNIIKCVKNAFLAFGYFDYIKFIYTELSIFPNDFNWQEFAENISTLVAVSTVSISRRYNIRYTGDDDTDDEDLTQGNLIEYLTAISTNVRGGTTRKFLFGFNAIANKYGYDEIEGIADIDAKVIKQIQYAILKLPNVIDIIANNNNVVSGIFDAIQSDTSDKYLAQVRRDDLLNALYRLMTNVLNKNYFVVTTTNVAIENGQGVEPPPINITKLDDYAIDISATIDNIMNSDMEIEMIYKTLDALMSNVMYAIDDFWRTYYTGTIKGIPLRVADIMSGGSVFDVDNDIATESTIIPEATPFYICAFVIVQTYCEQYAANDVDANRPRPILTNNAMSPIYKLVEVFDHQKDSATVDSISPQQMKKCIKVLNEIWNQTTGNSGAKLSQSIDLLFSELNALVVVATEYQRSIIETTGTPDSLYKETFITDIERTVTDLAKDITENRLRNVLTDPKRQIRIFESTLANAYKAISNEAPAQRLSLLKRLITRKGADTFDVNADLYKFMDTVITPILICTEAYSEVFKLYSSRTFIGNGNRNVESIDLTREMLFGGDEQIDDVFNIHNLSVSDAIERALNGEVKYVYLLTKYRDVVNRYNAILINNAICDSFETGVFKMPVLWVPVDLDSYPTEYVLNIKERGDNVDNVSATRQYLTLLQLYPHMKNVNSMSDFFENTCNEFINDVRQYFNAFYAYPDITEYVRQTVSKEFDAWKERFDANAQAFSTNIIGSTDLTKFKQYCGPFSYPRTVSIPAYQYNAKIPAIKTNPNPIPNNADLGNNEPFTMNWTNENFIVITSAERNNIPAPARCTYDWSDWVVYQIAKCDKINYCLPYKFVEIIYDLELNKYIKPAGLEEGSKGKIVWGTASDGTGYNLITQNIMLRSQHDKNKIEISSHHKGYIASIVSICPYILNTLSAVKSIVPPNVENADGYKIEKMIGELMDGVQNLYNEFLPSAPFVSFMSETPEGTRDSSAHIYGDVLELIDLKSSITMGASDFTKMTWANKYFFNSLQDITFPVYNTKNQFESIEKYASEKISNAAFHELYESNKQIIGKNAWMCLIAKTHEQLVPGGGLLESAYNTIHDTISNLHMLDIRVIEQYVNYILSYYQSANVIDNAAMFYGNAARLRKTEELYARYKIEPNGLGNRAQAPTFGLNGAEHPLEHLLGYDNNNDMYWFNAIDFAAFEAGNTGIDPNDPIYAPYTVDELPSIGISDAMATTRKLNMPYDMTPDDIVNVITELDGDARNDFLNNIVALGIPVAFLKYAMTINIQRGDNEVAQAVGALPENVILKAANVLKPDGVFNDLINNRFVEATRVGFMFANPNDAIAGGASGAVLEFINIGNIVGNKMHERMRSAYDIRPGNKAVIETLISTSFESTSGSDVEKLYNMILYYFKQRSINLSSIYNHIIYPNILYGSAVFRVALNKFNEAIHSALQSYNAHTNIYENVTRMEQYIRLFINNDTGFKYRYETQPNQARGRTNALNDANPLDPTRSVSINNKAMVEFMNVLSDTATRLYASNFPSVVMYFDAISTIITMVFLIVRETGVYDPETKRNRSLIGVNRDPFDINI